MMMIRLWLRLWLGIFCFDGYSLCSDYGLTGVGPKPAQDRLSLLLWGDYHFKTVQAVVSYYYYYYYYLFIYYAKWQHKYIYGKIRKRNTQLQL